MRGLCEGCNQCQSELIWLSYDSVGMSFFSFLFFLISYTDVNRVLKNAAVL